MLPISGSNVPPISNTSTRSNLLTQIDAIHEQANGEGQSIVQASENCVVSNQLYGESHTVTTNFFLTASDSNTKLIFEKLNGHAEAARYKPLAQLGTQIEELRTAYLNVLEEVDEIRDGLALYIPSKGQETADSKTSFTLIDKVRDFLSSNKKVFLLLGEAGSGKSTFNRYLTRTLWEEYPQSPTAPIPLFIALAEHRLSCDDLIESYLLEQGFTSEEIALLRKEKRLVFILDGFDETQDRTQAFYTQNKLDHWKNAQVIISSRPEYLRENYRSQFQKRGQTTAVQEYWLSTISDDWITAYIQKYIQHTQRTGWGLKWYQNTLNNLPTLKEAIRRPFLLRMALDLLPDLAESKSAPMTRIALYDAFISRWWNRSEERLLHIKLTDEEEKARCKLGQHLVAKGLRASQEMAIALTQKRLIQASYDPEKDEIIPEAWRTYLDENEVEKRLLLFNAPLIHQGQHYRFIHKSIQDYCVARAICGPQFKDAKPDIHAVLNRFLLVDEPLILDFLVERVKQHFSFKGHLHAWIESSKDRDAAVTVGAANAITVLVRAGVQFIGANLKGIRIPGADLSYGVFDHTQFEGADLSGVTLRGAWLRGANMREANLNGIEFGEKPALEVGNWVNVCSYSPDGRWLAVGTTEKGYIKLYQAQTLEFKYALERPHAGADSEGVNSVAFSPDSQWLASGGDDTLVKLWSVTSGELQHILTGHSAEVLSVTFSPNGQWLASSSRDKTIKVWTVQGKLLYPLEGHSDWVQSVSISPDGRWLASGSFDNTVKLWGLDSAGAVLRQTLEVGDKTFSVSISPDGNWLASGSMDNKVNLWELGSAGAVLRQTLEEHYVNVWNVSFSLDGKWLASGSEDYSVRLWELESAGAVLRQTFAGHSSVVRSISFSPDGEWLASGSWDMTVKLWSLRSTKALSCQTFEGHHHSVNSMSISSDGKWLASGSRDKTVKLWELGSAGAALCHTLEGHHHSVNSVSISLDGKWLASGSGDKTVKLWELGSAGAALRHTLEGHHQGVSSVSISSDGKWLASGSGDKTVKLWGLDSSGVVLRQTLEKHNDFVWSVSISPDSKWLASGGDDNTVSLWELGSAGAVLRHTLEGHHELEDYHEAVSSISFSPDGKWLASGNWDYSVKLWGLESTIKLRHTLKGHYEPVMSVSFSPDGKWLASGSRDRSVKLWALDTGEYEAKMTIQGFVGVVNSIIWREVAEGSAKIVLGGENNTIRIFQLEQKRKGWKSSLCWTSYQNELYVADLLIEGAQGLSPMNARLIEQRQRVAAEFLEEDSDELSFESEESGELSSEEENFDEFNMSRSFELENLSQNVLNLANVPIQENLDLSAVEIDRIWRLLFVDLEQERELNVSNRVIIESESLPVLAKPGEMSCDEEGTVEERRSGAEFPLKRKTYSARSASLEMERKVGRVDDNFL
ncbi:MAG: WD40 repeat [Glomeribacter sp. 1016415]|nr:WD40 repeat [Glomeribacter sp. 1016415]